jgi:adenylate kinase family enzyme
VPSQVFLMNMPKEAIFEQAQLQPSVLEQKLKLHFRHGLAALEAYMDNLKQIDLSFGTDEEIWAEIDAEVKLRPYSKAPKRAPRTVLLGPPGSDNKAYAEKLADSLGAVVVDGTVLSKDVESFEGVDTLSEAVFARISQNDCQQNGWVLTNYPETLEQAQKLKESEFAPIRVVLLECSMGSCVRRQSSQFVDPVTGTMWTRPPKDEVIRKRLKRNPADVPQYVQVRYESFLMSIDDIFDTISSGGNGAKVMAEGDPREVSDVIAEFVERPLSFELLNV